MTGTLDDQEEDCDKSLLRNRATPATDQNQCRRTTIYERSAGIAIDRLVDVIDVIVPIDHRLSINQQSIRQSNRSMIDR